MDTRTVSDSRSSVVHRMGPGDALVALDDDGRPATVPGLTVDSDEKRHRESEAQLRRRNRLAEREQIRAARAA